MVPFSWIGDTIACNQVLGWEWFLKDWSRMKDNRSARTPLSLLRTKFGMPSGPAEKLH